MLCGRNNCDFHLVSSGLVSLLFSNLMEPLKCEAVVLAGTCSKMTANLNLKEPAR